MRPKKRILLVDQDENRLGILRFVLSTHYFRVFGAADALEAREFLRAEYPEVLLLVWPLEQRSVEALLCANDRQSNRASVLLVAENEITAPTITANRFLLGRDCRPANLLEASRICAQRRRGPKKKPPRSFNPAWEAYFWAELDSQMTHRSTAEDAA